MSKELQSQAWRAHDNDTDEMLFLEHLAKLARDKTPPAHKNDHGWQQIKNVLRPKIGNTSQRNT